MTAIATKNLSKLQWHSLPTSETAQRLESNLETGLILAEAEQRYNHSELAALAESMSTEAIIIIVLLLERFDPIR